MLRSTHGELPLQGIGFTQQGKLVEAAYLIISTSARLLTAISAFCKTCSAIAYHISDYSSCQNRNQENLEQFSMAVLVFRAVT